MQIISRDSICVHEELLFRNIDFWVSRVDEDTGNVWRQIFQHVRLGRMGLDFFLEQIVKKHITDDQLSLKVIGYLSTVNEPLDQQYTRHRAVVRDSDTVVNRFLQCSKQCTWIVDNTLNGDRISFQ